MTTISEIAPDIYRLSTYVEQMNLQFNQFLVNDDEPLLFHTGMKALFPDVKAALSRVIKPSKLRWISFSHFEADECGALSDWQRVAPRATALCTLIGKHTSVDDVVALREANAMQQDEVLSTGHHRFRFLQTPHVPHGWDSSMFYEEQSGTLFCSDILYHKGNVAALATGGEIMQRFQDSMRGDQLTPWAHAYPCSDDTRATYRRLADLDPQVLAIMHGSAHSGSSRQLLMDYAAALEEFAAPGMPAAIAA
jgi:flavorubredoxin